MDKKAVLVRFPDHYGSSLSKRIEDVARLFAVQVNVERKKPRLLASTDTLLYAAVAYIVFKPFIESFLKELGSKTAQSLSEALKKLIPLIKAKKPRTLNRYDLRQLNRMLKRDGDRAVPRAQVKAIGTPNPLLAIRIQFSEHFSVDFVFPHSVTPSDAKTGIGAIAPIVEEHAKAPQPQHEVFLVHGAEISLPPIRHYEYLLQGHVWSLSRRIESEGVHAATSALTSTSTRTRRKNRGAPVK